jgi:hypothetical protein
MIGKRVKFLPGPMPQDLVGQTGTVESQMELGAPNAWIVTLDNDVPGHYSGTAWAFTDELEVIE